MDNTGKCHCGQVQYTFDGGIKTVVNCHCSLCRHMNGVAYSTYVVIPLASLSIVRGKDVLSEYQATDGAIKHYCRDCGTPLFNSNSIRYPGLAMLYAGSLSDSAAVTPEMNIYCESRLPWVDKVMELRSFMQGPGKPE